MIKVRVRALKESIRSSLLREYIEMDELEASRFIRSKASDEIATDDIVDEDTGEVYIEKGKPYGQSILHQDEGPRQEQNWKNQMSAFDDDDLDDDDWEAEWDRASGGLEAERAEASKAWDAALEEYTSNWGPDNLADFEGSGITAEDIAQDGVLGFFYEYPEWERWSELLDMDKGTMKSILSDYVYDALTR